MSTVAEILTSLKVLFTEYAGKSGNKETLSKRELAEMLHKEVPGTEVSGKDLTTKNGDGEVDFKEFVNFAVTLNIHYQEGKPGLASIIDGQI
uniref:EF-hand domain-containing protein n=1 Tax=Amphiprion ocellaris TaxID=80972 RepID=A0A3Q1BQC3_AMPOC